MQITGKERWELVRDLEDLIEGIPEHFTLWLHARSTTETELRDVDKILTDVLPYVDALFPVPQ